VPTVLALPDFDLSTRCASGWLLRWILPRLEPAHLFGILDRRFAFQFFAPQSDIIIMTGHGGVDVITGQNEAVILAVGKYDPREVRGKVFKLLSCQCGVALGPDLIKNGASSVAAYVDDYVWVTDADLASTPWADKMAATSLMPVIDGINALLDGKTAKEAFTLELEGYTRNAEIEEDELIKSCLEFNKRNAILLGNEGATIRARPKITLPFAPPPILIPL